MRKTLPAILLVIFLCSAPPSLRSQSNADAQLLAAIEKIKAIDNHAHPLKYVAPGEKPDNEFDALPLDAIEQFPLPVRLSPSNLEFVNAWHDFYGYKHDDMSADHLRDLMAMKQRVAQEQGERFPTWTLDQ